MLGTRCEFMANFAIPDYIGLGKSVSGGFGVVVGIKGARLSIGEAARRAASTVNQNKD